MKPPTKLNPPNPRKPLLKPPSRNPKVNAANLQYNTPIHLHLA
ncbi:hypothetical protein [Helicobacter pylori]|nr:hypothetical protein [Helicobacter pylori]